MAKTTILPGLGAAVSRMAKKHGLTLSRADQAKLVKKHQRAATEAAHATAEQALEKELLAQFGEPAAPTTPTHNSSLPGAEMDYTSPETGKVYAIIAGLSGPHRYGVLADGPSGFLAVRKPYPGSGHTVKFYPNAAAFNIDTVKLQELGISGSSIYNRDDYQGLHAVSESQLQIILKYVATLRGFKVGTDTNLHAIFKNEKPSGDLLLGKPGDNKMPAKKVRTPSVQNKTVSTSKAKAPSKIVDKGEVLKTRQKPVVNPKVK